MEMVKVKNIKTGAIKEVKKSLASDYLKTGEFVVAKEEKKIESKPKTSFRTVDMSSETLND